MKVYGKCLSQGESKRWEESIRGCLEGACMQCKYRSQSQAQALILVELHYSRLRRTSASSQLADMASTDQCDQKKAVLRMAWRWANVGPRMG